MGWQYGNANLNFDQYQRSCPTQFPFLSITLGHKVREERTNRWSTIKRGKRAAKKLWSPYKKDTGAKSGWSHHTCGFCCSFVWHLKCIWLQVAAFPDPADVKPPLTGPAFTAAICQRQSYRISFPAAPWRSSFFLWCLPVYNVTTFRRAKYS